MCLQRRIYRRWNIISKCAATQYTTTFGIVMFLGSAKGAERLHGTPPRLLWSEQDMTEPERQEYGAAKEGSAPLPSLNSYFSQMKHFGNEKK